MHQYLKSLQHDSFPFQLSIWTNHIHVFDCRSTSLWSFYVLCNILTTSIRLGNRLRVWRDVFTAALSSLQASRTFNKIACKETGREMMETPVDTACHCGLAKLISNAQGFELGLVI